MTASPSRPCGPSGTSHAAAARCRRRESTRTCVGACAASCGNRPARGSSALKSVRPTSSHVLARSLREHAECEPARVALAEHEREPQTGDAVDDVDGVAVADAHRPQADVGDRPRDARVLRPAPEQVGDLAAERGVGEHLVAERVERADEACARCRLRVRVGMAEPLSDPAAADDADLAHAGNDMAVVRPRASGAAWVERLVEGAGLAGEAVGRAPGPRDPGRDVVAAGRDGRARAEDPEARTARPAAATAALAAVATVASVAAYADLVEGPVVAVAAGRAGAAEPAEPSGAAHTAVPGLDRVAGQRHARGVHGEDPERGAAAGGTAAGRAAAAAGTPAAAAVAAAVNDERTRLAAAAAATAAAAAVPARLPGAPGAGE